MTRRVFELRNELLEPNEQRNHNFKNDLANMEFVSRLAYQSEIFDTLNDMNMFFQGPLKLQAYLRKPDLWISKIEVKQCHMFKIFSSLQRSEKFAAIYNAKDIVDALFLEHR